jgi:hypothetical protein
MQFWRKVFELGPDSAVRSSTRGHLLLLFSDSTRLVHHGRCQVFVREIHQERLTLAIDELSILRIAGGTRVSRFVLPEGTTVEMKGGQATVELVDDRLLLVRNFASERLTLSSERGVVTLEHNERCVLPLVRNEHPRPPFLAATEGQEVVEFGAGNDAVRAGAPAQMETEGRLLNVVTSGEPAAVRWGGASFKLKPSSRLVLDPLAGDRFPLSSAHATVPAGRSGGEQPQDGTGR